jgi:hypothetical protein
VIRRFPSWIVLVAASVVVLLAGCTRIGPERAIGEQLLADTHSAMGRGDWKGIYAGADPELRAGTSEDKFGALFLAISKKLGSPVSVKATEWNLDKASDGTFLKATCKTKFSNNASGTETFEWRKTDGNYLLFSYHIKSDQLKTR